MIWVGDMEYVMRYIYSKRDMHDSRLLSPLNSKFSQKSGQLFLLGDYGLTFLLVCSFSWTMHFSFCGGCAVTGPVWNAMKNVWCLETTCSMPSAGKKWVSRRKVKTQKTWSNVYRSTMLLLPRQNNLESQTQRKYCPNMFQCVPLPSTHWDLSKSHQIGR